MPDTSLEPVADRMVDSLPDMTVRPGPDASLAELGGRLKDLVGQVADSLAARDRLSGSVNEFSQAVDGSCGSLSRRIESLSMAKAGLEAMLASYSTRYGGLAEDLDEVGQFRTLLADKIRDLESSRTSLDEQGRDVAGVLGQLMRLETEAGDMMAELDQALFAARAAKAAQLQRLSEERDQVHSLARRYWPGSEPVPGPGAETISPRTMSWVINRALDNTCVEEADRCRILSRVVETIRDETLREAVFQNLAARRTQSPAD